MMKALPNSYKRKCRSKIDKTMMNKYIISFICAVSAFVSVEAQDNVIDQVEWVVGDKAILRSDIEEAIQYWLSNDRRFDGDPYCVVGEDLAVQQLFLHQAALDSIEVDENQIMMQVDKQMDAVIQRVGSKEKMEEYMNLTSSQIREMYREQIYNYNMMGQMKNKIVGDIKVSPALVRRYYNSLPEDSIPYVPTMFEVQILTQEPELDREEVERVKEDLRDYTERINNGETSFSSMAILYSQDPGTARRGGEVGFSSRAQFAPEFANVAFNLTDPNKVSKIVETEYGFHIMQLIEKRGDRVNVRHILRIPRISNQSINDKLARLDSIAEDINNNLFTFEEGAMHISDDKETRNNRGIMYNKMTSSPRFELQELPVEVARVVDGMQVGEISAPFTIMQNNGKTICAIVKLKSKVEGHKASLKDDYDTLKELYTAKKRDEKVKQWIEEKQKTTFVRINKANRDCEFLYPGWVFYEEK